MKCTYLLKHIWATGRFTHCKQLQINDWKPKSIQRLQYATLSRIARSHAADNSYLRISCTLLLNVSLFSIRDCPEMLCMCDKVFTVYLSTVVRTRSTRKIGARIVNPKEPEMSRFLLDFIPGNSFRSSWILRLKLRRMWMESVGKSDFKSDTRSLIRFRVFQLKSTASLARQKTIILLFPIIVFPL